MVTRVFSRVHHTIFQVGPACCIPSKKKLQHWIEILVACGFQRKQVVSQTSMLLINVGNARSQYLSGLYLQNKFNLLHERSCYTHEHINVLACNKIYWSEGDHDKRMVYRVQTCVTPRFSTMFYRIWQVRRLLVRWYVAGRSFASAFHLAKKIMLINL